MITFEEAKELFTYDREAGIIKWRKRFSGRQRNSLVAGSTDFNGNGYTRIRLKGKPYFAHQIAMLLSYGFYVDGLEVDHINHIRDDNRLVNLRFVAPADNQRNLSRYNNNASGVTGVFYRKDRRKYVARIKANGVNIHLGYFSTLEEAAKARKDADIKYKYNANHGTNKTKEYVTE